MRVTFHGAAGEVTGSCYSVETDNTRVLVDFGFFQGAKGDDERNRALPKVDFGGLDAVLLTHAHLDHAGRLPLLPGTGFKGPIVCTPATRDLSEILLLDSARLQEADAKRAERRGGPPEPALYSTANVLQVLSQFSGLEYGQERRIGPDLTVRYIDSGHILGSASIEITAAESGRTKRVVFSGDVGPRGVPLMNDPVLPTPGADLVVLESTYGDRDHRPLDATLDEAEEIVRGAIWEKQKVLVPSFAIGRAQLVIYYLSQLMATGRVPMFPVYLDSPMAIQAMALYKRHLTLLDEHARARVRGRFALEPRELRCLETAEDSKALNTTEGASVIIAGSGMCEGGRIVHHLRNSLWRKDVHVLIVGYQATGTLGRRLVDGAAEVRIFGDTIPVRAQVHTLGGLSAHAGQTELLEWGIAAKGAQYALTHGEASPRNSLGGLLRQHTKRQVLTPALGDVIQL